MYFHVWFPTKYRRETLLGTIESIVLDAFSEVSCNKNISILEMNLNLDHVHLLLGVEDRKTLSDVVRVLKAVSAKRANEYLRKIGADSPHVSVGSKKTTHFWARRFCYKEVPPDRISQVQDYIRNQK